MKKATSCIYNQRGIITVVVLFVLLGVGVLALNTVLNSQMNQTSANNYKHKIQTFHAADGLMTMLAQEVIDTSEGNYLHDNMLNQDIGNPAITGSHSYDPVIDIDTIKAGGKHIWGESDQFHFFYTRIKGDFDISVKVNSLTVSDPWAKGGIMVRENLTSTSKHAMVYRPAIAAFGIRFLFRRTDGADVIDSTSNYYDAAYWIRMKRKGNNFSAYRSSNSDSWAPIDSRTIPMTDSVYVGLALTANTETAMCTGIFSNLKGIARKSCIDSTFVGINNDIPVKYTIDEVGAGVYNMSTEAYKPKGTTRMHNFVTSLNQKISRERMEAWKTYVNDSAFIPVTLYDMRSDRSNPEFNVEAYTDINCAHIVRTDTLTIDRKVVRRNPNSTFRTCFMSLFDPDWYIIDAVQRGSHSVSPSDKLNCIAWDPSISWCFNDSMHTWFRPWGDSAGKTGTYTYDYLNNRWSGLKVRPGWTSGPGHDTEWVTVHWDSTHPFANIVVYDSLKFIEDSLQPGLISFGKDLSDQRWFNKLKIKNYSTGQCEYWNSPIFMPLQNKGFGCDLGFVDSCDPVAFKKLNYSFTMEIHRKFTFKHGQTFLFRGDDDVFVFINNRCVIDLGGIHSPLFAHVDLDTLGLTEGKEYMFDFFYAERCLWGSDILITTNLLTYTPPQASKRNWKRDYGNID